MQIHSLYNNPRASSVSLFRRSQPHFGDPVSESPQLDEFFETRPVITPSPKSIVSPPSPFFDRHHEIVLHELGHILAAWAMGISPSNLNISKNEKKGTWFPLSTWKSEANFLKHFLLDAAGYAASKHAFKQKQFCSDAEQQSHFNQILYDAYEDTRDIQNTLKNSLQVDFLLKNSLQVSFFKPYTSQLKALSDLKLDDPNQCLENMQAIWHFPLVQLAVDCAEKLYDSLGLQTQQALMRGLSQQTQYSAKEIESLLRSQLTSEQQEQLKALFTEYMTTAKQALEALKTTPTLPPKPSAVEKPQPEKITPSLDQSIKKTAQILYEAGFAASDFEIKQLNNTPENAAVCQIMVSPSLALAVKEALYQAGYSKVFWFPTNQLFCTDLDAKVKYLIPLSKTDFPTSKPFSSASVSQPNPFFRWWARLRHLLLRQQ